MTCRRVLAEAVDVDAEEDNPIVEDFDVDVAGGAELLLMLLLLLPPLGDVVDDDGGDWSEGS